MNLESILYMVGVDEEDTVCCFPSEGSSFEMTWSEFKEEFPWYVDDVKAQLIPLVSNNQLGINSIKL